MAIDTKQVAQLDVEPGELPPTMAAWVIREAVSYTHLTLPTTPYV